MFDRVLNTPVTQLPTTIRNFMCFDVTFRVNINSYRSILCQTGSHSGSIGIKIRGFGFESHIRLTYISYRKTLAYMHMINTCTYNKYFPVRNSFYGKIDACKFLMIVPIFSSKNNPQLELLKYSETKRDNGQTLVSYISLSVINNAENWKVLKQMET